MHRLKNLVDEAICIVEDDLECEIRKVKNCTCSKDIPPHVLHEIREDLDSLEDAVCIKKYMGWLSDKPAHPLAGM